MPLSDPVRHSESHAVAGAGAAADTRVASAARRLAGAVGAGLLVLTAFITARAALTFDPLAQPVGWSVRPALSSSLLSSGTEVVYRSEYKSGLWTGTVRANHIDANGVTQSTSPWPSVDTASTMAAKSWDTGRRIVTRTGAGVAVPFRFASLDASQQSALGGATNGPLLLNFIRGDRSNEAPAGAKFRARFSIQGDILHSSLLYWKHLSGPKRLYVGGNDGMLHVFDAANGNEVFAYVPSMVVSRLPQLSASPYLHSTYVDGGLAIADVTVGTSTRTLLAGALGGGGRGLFMLDVTDPSPATEAAAAAAIKWEITSSQVGYTNLGYTYAVPKLARMNNGVAAVVVGNGYMNTGNGRASLFVINADTGALIKEVDTGSGGTASPNGLSSATLVDADGNGTSDYAYAGDIDGNLWRFDLTAADPKDWSSKRLLATSPAQAITVPPVITNHPAGGRMVLFGTGRVLSPADQDDGNVHYVYGLWDGAPGGNSNWLDQTLTQFTSGTQTLRRLSALQPDWNNNGHRGWRLALPAGERITGDAPFTLDGRYYFTTTNPTVQASGDYQAGGSTWLMEVMALTGGSPATAIFDINADGKIDAADNLGDTPVVGKYLGNGVVSQPVLADMAASSVTLFNQQSDVDYGMTPSTAVAGVSGGHFDPDFYGVTGGRFLHIKHRHQYDDSFNVTGLNMLNASDPTYNLGSILPTSTSFKVLVMNQYLNPAAMMAVGSGGFVNVKNYPPTLTTTTGDAVLSQLPSYKLGSGGSSIGSLIFKLPLDAFRSKDWWGDGQPVRAGLIPTTTGCVKSVSADGGTPRLGPNGERHDGALTVQIIKASTPGSALELNYPGGGSKYGWRVRKADFLAYVLAEYTYFWHHPNGKCYGDSGWVQNPPEDTRSNNGNTRGVAGSADPRDGAFTAVPVGVTVTGTSTTVSGNVTTIVVSYSDSKTDRMVITVNADGTESVALTDRGGNVTNEVRMTSGALGRGPTEALVPSRRINWRELVRP